MPFVQYKKDWDPSVDDEPAWNEGCHESKFQPLDYIISGSSYSVLWEENPILIRPESFFMKDGTYHEVNAQGGIFQIGNHNVTMEIISTLVPTFPRRYIMIQIEVLACKVETFVPGT